MDTDEVIKKWAADKYDVEVDEIESFYDSLNFGTCGYGTCEYRDIDITVYFKDKRKKPKTTTFYDLGDCLRALLPFAG